MSCTKMAESIEMSFGLWARVDPRKHALGGGSQRRHLTNPIELSTCSGDAACCRIALTTC